jgi:hypothetical protein
MGSLLQIRDVTDEQRRLLKARAAARGQSLNSYMLELIEREVSRPPVAEVLDCPLITRDRRLARSSGHAAQVTVL